MLKKAIALLFVLHVCIEVQAQRSCTSTFQGRVTDSDGNALVGASVLVNPGNLGQSTDAEGSFQFADLCSGVYTVTVQFVGYQSLSQNLKVSGTVSRNFTLTEEVTQLVEVVISHHDAANVEHATNYSLLNERKLSESAGKSLGEMVKAIPGVTTLQTGPGIFKPVVHGVHSQRLLILNHGIRQEGQQWGAEHAPEIDPFIASSIVVIKDASAIKFGPDALGGVVVVNPPALPERHDLGGMISSVLKSNGRMAILSGMIEGGVKRHEGWGWRVQGTAKRGGDFRTPDYFLTNTGVKELNFSAAAGYHKKKLGVDLFFSRFQSELGILKGTSIGNLDDLVSAMERDVPLYTSSFSYDVDEPRQEVAHNLFKSNIHLHGSKGEWRFQYGFQKNDRQEYDVRVGELSNIPSMDLQLTTHTFDGEWETHHSESRTLVFGVNAMQQVNHNVPGTRRIPFVPNFENVSAGVFVTSKFFIENWTIDAGARYDYRTYSVRGFDFKNAPYKASMDFGNISASLGVSHSLTHQQTIKLNVSTAWRPPHVSELYSLGTHQSAAAIEYGLMLDPVSNDVRRTNEVSINEEKAIKAVATYHLHKEAFTVEVTGYANYIADYIYLRPEGITRNVRGVYPYFRYDQADALFIGADLDASIKLSSYLTVLPRASFLRARNITDRSYFLFVPSNRISADVRYERPAMGSFVRPYFEVGGVFVARQRFAPRVITVRELKEALEQNSDPLSGSREPFDFSEAPEDYFLVNASAGFSLKTKVRYDFRLAVENVFNERYRDYSNRFRYYADDLGRNIVLSVKCIF